MITPQGLQIDSLARLGIIRNGIIIVNIVFRVCIADCRRVPMRMQSRTNLFLLWTALGCDFAFMFISLVR
jgi:hypothetical protein